MKKLKFSKKEQILFLEKLELYLEAGLALDKSLNIIGQTASKKQKTFFPMIVNKLHSGSRFGLLLETHTNFSQTVISLIVHGETSGGLARSISFSKSLLERDDELRKKVLSSLSYPMIIAIFAISLTVGLMRGVMPQIVPMLRSLNVKLPIITVIAMTSSDLLAKYGFIIILAGFITITLIILLYRKNNFRYALQLVVLEIPIIKSLLSIYSASVFIRSLGSQIESGIPLDRAYSEISKSISLLPFKKRLCVFENEIKTGIPLASIFFKIKYFPNFIPALVSAGESTGFLGQSLSRAAAIMDREIDHSLKKMTSLIEPLMMIFMGGIIGGIALSIMLPIYDVSKALQH